MKGKIFQQTQANGTVTWCLRYVVNNDDGTETITNYEITPKRIEDLIRQGNDLKENDELEFNIKKVEYFPYVYAHPFIPNYSNTYSTHSNEIPVNVKKVTKIRIRLQFAGFGYNKDFVTCDGWDANSSGYYYFYDKDENNHRIILKLCPINRTIIESIENIEIEVKE